MEKFELKESFKTPRILIDFERGLINITGRSSLENPQDLYPRINNIIQQYCENPKQTTNVLIDLEYYNEASANYLFEILHLLNNSSILNKSTLKIFWHYDPDDYGIIGDINKTQNILTCKVYAIAYELL